MFFKSLISSNKAEVNNPASIDPGFVYNAVSFFDGYLSLCNKHSVIGNSTLSLISKHEGELQAVLSCTLFSIDGEHACEALNVLKMAFPDGHGWIKNSEEVMAEYFGTSSLHWTFTEPENFRIQNSEVIISSDVTLFMFGGAKWETTVSAIKNKLLEKWPKCSIAIGKSGLIVKAK